MPPDRTNVADALARAATDRPDAPAVIEAWGEHRQVTFGQIDADADRLARGLVAMGVRPGTRMALLVKPGIEFVTLVFALLRSGATMVLVDAGLGRKNIVRCLASTSPDGFVAIPLGHVLRCLKRASFPKAKLNVTVGRRLFWGGETLDGLRRLGDTKPSLALPRTGADDPAALVFTSGSTGPPKGVVYRHETFATQLAEIQRMYGLNPGGVDLACFPLFGLFNVAMGITTVLPEMDFSRPASADPAKLIAAANRYKVTQSFASPAVWDRLSRYCEDTDDSIQSLQQLFSCGAPVSAKVISRTLGCVHPEAEMHTPYGATECLPVSTIEAHEILSETNERTSQGAGVCVGRKVESIEWRVIEITDEPIATIDGTTELPAGEIGELIVRGPQISRVYDNSPHHNRLAKIADSDSVWHRIGDVGYLDHEQRFWYCGRKSQRVVMKTGTLFTECVEGVFNTHPQVRRSALVGTGKRPAQEPAIVVELERPTLDIDRQLHEISTRHDCTRPVEQMLVHPQLPTDIRHNAKINREVLAKWAEKRLKA